MSEIEQRNNQLLQDNIEMHRIIEMLRLEMDQNMNELTAENQTLHLKVTTLEQQAVECQSDHEKVSMDLKSRLASALRTANVKSEEATKWQVKYEQLTAKIEAKRRSKMFEV